jgi:cytochrome P450
VVVRETVLPPRGGAPPITTDPPKHRGAKNVLLPAFTPEAIARHEPRARAICRELLAGLDGKRSCDAALSYAQEIPVRVIAHMLGGPEQDGEQFRTWIHEVLELGVTDDEVLTHATDEMTAYFRREAEKRRAAPGDDLISHLIKTRINGNPR